MFRESIEKTIKKEKDHRQTTSAFRRVCHVLSYLSRLINAFAIIVLNCYFLNALRAVLVYK